MKTTYVLIDFENVQVKSLALLKGEHFQVKVFLGPKNARLPVDLVLAMHDLGKRADYIMLGVSGANALDFHITYYLGKLTADDPKGLFYIVSKDTGFDSLIKHLLGKGLHCKRVPAIEQMPGLPAAPLAVDVKGEAKAEAKKAVQQPKTKPVAAPPKAKTRGATPAKKAVPPVTAVKEVKEQKESRELKESNTANKLVGEALVQAAITNLMRRSSSRPATVKTLLGTMRANKQIPAAEADAVLAEMVSRGLVKLNGTKVVYSLPGE